MSSQGFEEADRGQLIMACGTGKTMVGLWVWEALDAPTALVVLPSLSLLAQTVREWCANACQRLRLPGRLLGRVRHRLRPHRAQRQRVALPNDHRPRAHRGLPCAASPGAGG